MEHLQWSEDMGIDRMLVVYAGFSLDVYGQSGASYPEDQMHVILQEALDELAWATHRRTGAQDEPRLTTLSLS